MKRCDWVNHDQLYIDYHDNEWGIPQIDSKKLFEMICLEGQQAGLSWIIILKKRQNYRNCFYQFNPNAISTMSNEEIKKILQNPGIIRHQKKIESIINNARAYLSLEQKGKSFSEFIWSFVNNTPQLMHTTNLTKNYISTPDADKLSNALKNLGFKFVGTKICYAFMQACGLINAHTTNCFRHPSKERSLNEDINKTIIF